MFNKVGWVFTALSRTKIDYSAYNKLISIQNVYSK